jgi:hypothetical protein
VTITIREAEAHELEQVRSQWLSRVVPRRKDSGGGEHPTGRKGHRVALGLSRKAIELLVDELVADAVVLVAVVATAHGDEVVGWAAHDGANTLFVCVPSGYGRRGLGTALRQRCPGELLWSTPNGRAWKRAMEAHAGPLADSA